MAEIEAEMMKQESLLGHLHAQVAAGNVSRRKEESLWEAQRIVTLLKVGTWHNLYYYYYYHYYYYLVGNVSRRKEESLWEQTNYG